MTTAPWPLDDACVIRPRDFGRRDLVVALAFVAAMATSLVVAVRVGTPGVLGCVYVGTAALVWAQDFRRAWSVADGVIAVRRWFRWQRVDAGDVVELRLDHDDMGVRAVELRTPDGQLVIGVDEMFDAPLVEARIRQLADAHGVELR